MATGRSDYPNQINNVLGFPYIFRGALDVRAKTINMEMKIAAVNALAELAREGVPDEVASAYRGSRPRFGREYLIPVPFDPRLISVVPPAVAQAAMDTGVARKPIVDMKEYRHELSARRDPVAGVLQSIFERVRRSPKRVVFAEGEEEQVICAALSFVNQGLGTAVLVGREERLETAANAGIDLGDKDIEIHNAQKSQHNSAYAQLFTSACSARASCCAIVSASSTTTATISPRRWWRAGDADAMVSGVTRNFSIALEEVRCVIDDKPGHRLIGVSIVLTRGEPIIVADTAITEMPEAEDLADIAVEAAGIGAPPRLWRRRCCR